MPGKIVVGYDGSEAGAKALDHALMLAGKLDAALCLIHVIDWSPFEYHTLEENEVRAKESSEEVETDRRELFPPAEEKAREAGIDCTSELRYGHPAEVLGDLAEETNALCIVVGRTGTSRLKNLLLGSVPSKLVLLARCPVVVVP